MAVGGGAGDGRPVEPLAVDDGAVPAPLVTLPADEALAPRGGRARGGKSQRSADYSFEAPVRDVDPVHGALLNQDFRAVAASLREALAVDGGS
ncbi:hypothetical protein [Streptomyces sp. NPDC006997]|uniref:hypothetical protein n=1 Tax=Streptomyces sp. NPDC006997 TaxID=3155356 RepID=UPI0033E6DA51